MGKANNQAAAEQGAGPARPAAPPLGARPLAPATRAAAPAPTAHPPRNAAAAPAADGPAPQPAGAAPVAPSRAPPAQRHAAQALAPPAAAGVVKRRKARPSSWQRRKLALAAAAVAAASDARPVPPQHPQPRPDPADVQPAPAAHPNHHQEGRQQQQQQQQQERAAAPPDEPPPLPPLLPMLGAQLLPRPDAGDARGGVGSPAASSASAPQPITQVRTCCRLPRRPCIARIARALLHAPPSGHSSETFAATVPSQCQRCGWNRRAKVEPIVPSDRDVSRLHHSFAGDAAAQPCAAVGLPRRVCAHGQRPGGARPAAADGQRRRVRGAAAGGHGVQRPGGRRRRGDGVAAATLAAVALR